MKFILSGKMIFDAKGLDDAFMKLSKHFKDMRNGGDGMEMYPGSKVTLKIKKGKNENIR